MTEIWKDIEGYEGLYQVSNFGNVKGIQRVVKGKHGTQVVKERLLQKHLDKGGYLVVKLSKNNEAKVKKIHRLVAIAFVPNPLNKIFVNHKDECKTNNNVDNLEWCTSKYNNRYGTRIERARISQSKVVLQYSTKGEYIKTWESITKASETLHIHNSSITECCKKKRKTAGGFIWKYGDGDAI